MRAAKIFVRTEPATARPHAPGKELIMDENIEKPDSETGSLRDCQSILFFDGHCHLCAGSVQFALKRDKKGRVCYAPLQGSKGSWLKLEFPETAELDSLILYTGGRVYWKSEAVLRLARLLGFPWFALSCPAWLLPRSWRDHLYDFIARHRYQWFGKSETCWMPRPGWRDRFLN